MGIQIGSTYPLNGRDRWKLSLNVSSLTPDYMAAAAILRVLGNDRKRADLITLGYETPFQIEALTYSLQQFIRDTCNRFRVDSDALTAQGFHWRVDLSSDAGGAAVPNYPFAEHVGREFESNGLLAFQLKEFQDRWKHAIRDSNNTGAAAMGISGGAILLHPMAPARSIGFAATAGVAGFATNKIQHALTTKRQELDKLAEPAVLPAIDHWINIAANHDAPRLIVTDRHFKIEGTFFYPWSKPAKTKADIIRTLEARAITSTCAIHTDKDFVENAEYIARRSTNRSRLPRNMTGFCIFARSGHPELKDIALRMTLMDRFTKDDNCSAPAHQNAYRRSGKAGRKPWWSPWNTEAQHTP